MMERKSDACFHVPSSHQTNLHGAAGCAEEGRLRLRRLRLCSEPLCLGVLGRLRPLEAVRENEG